MLIVCFSVCALPTEARAAKTVTCGRKVIALGGTCTGISGKVEWRWPDDKAREGTGFAAIRTTIASAHSLPKLLLLVCAISRYFVITDSRAVVNGRVCHEARYLAWSAKNGYCCQLFDGSGVFFLACEDLGRRFYHSFPACASIH